MQKKPGQISANTLSLRFMQNAAKSKQEKAVEAAKAKVKSQEEWEISASVREGWGIGDDTTDAQGTVTYEQSYLPFLFPRLPGANAASASTSTAYRPGSSQDGAPDMEDSPQFQMKGRRIFGKHGEEKVQEPPPPEPSTLPDQPHPSTSAAPPPSRGPRTISSHSRSAASKQRPASPPAQSSVQRTIFKKPSGPPVFMKPQVDAPRAEGGERKRRTTDDVRSTEDGQRKRKKRKNVEA